MSVPAATREALERRGIRIFVARSRDAVPESNRLSKEDDGVAAALHLTC